MGTPFSFYEAGTWQIAINITNDGQAPANLSGAVYNGERMMSMHSPPWPHIEAGDEFQLRIARSVEDVDHAPVNWSQSYVAVQFDNAPDLTYGNVTEVRR